ncbi:MAG: MarR family transcriptional regulator, transcriptional regulator for hemolysin [Solirubrobacterales bacterium]|jgi:DNA-binding MarR family transcriptional regulator|nr:MarR family transcriptional regulator, transcriptional regulator for hemolysin [Solirubrobacterales bacterium]
MEIAIAAPKSAEADSLAECPDCLSGNLGWLLSQAHFNLVSEIAAAFEPVGVSNRGYHVLATARGGEYTQKELAERIGLDKTTMVVTVDELEKEGLAERRPSSTDRRARVISVTKAGERKVRQGQEIVERIQNDVLTSLPSTERKVFLESLGMLVKDRLSEPAECSPPLRRREPKA